jgi:hypothetical protein
MGILKRFFDLLGSRPKPVNRSMKARVLETIVTPHLQDDPQKMCQALNFLRYSTKLIIEILDYIEFELKDSRKNGTELDTIYENVNATYEGTMKGIRILRANKRYLAWNDEE